MERDNTEELSKYLRKVGKLASREGGPGQELSKQVIESFRTAGKLLV